MKKTWKKTLAACCAAAVLVITPGISVLANELQDEVIADQPIDIADDAAKPDGNEDYIAKEYIGSEIDEAAGQEIDEEVIGAGDITVGSNVTASFDSETGAVKLYSNGGTLWKDWIARSRINLDDIRSIEVASGPVYLPKDSSGIFAAYFYDPISYTWKEAENLSKLDLDGFDTSNVTNMSAMFRCCENLTELDLSGFDTTNVTDMSSMFWRCSSLTDLDLRSFDTKNVKDMDAMFADCNALENVNLSSFDTSNVTNMDSMFYICISLENLDLSRFNTSNVTDMEDMFATCQSLLNLDLSNFDTSNVTSMGGMFVNCSALKNLNLGGFDTRNVTDMNDMFNNCKSLKNLDLRSFSTPKVTDMDGMFANCKSLEDLRLGSFKNTNVTDMDFMFSQCSSLPSLDLSDFYTPNVTDMSYMFSGDTKLTYLDLSSFDTSSVNSFTHMLYNCTGLEILKTPKKNAKSGFSLPLTMYDSAGNEYTELPLLSKSIVLGKTQKTAQDYENPTKVFSDVQDPSHPYYDAIYWAAEKGITGGYKDGTFGINKACTRGHAVMFLWKMAGAPAPAAVTKTPFSDVPKTHPYYKAVLWAQQKGITKGYTSGANKGKFGIDDTCTRGQIMTFIWNYKRKPAPKSVSKSPFSDVPTSHPYYKAILWGSQNGVTKGYTTGPNAGKFGINDNCTRGQIVKFLYNIR